MSGLKQKRSGSGGRIRSNFPELERDKPALIATIKKGLPADRIEKLKALLDMPIGDLLELLSIPSSTFSRRRRQGELTRDESERVYRMAHLLLRATDLFGSLEEARIWLKRPQYALGGVPPLDFADTEPGAREVEDLLGRIDHGIPV